jgi:hypothetical protein
MERDTPVDKLKIRKLTKTEADNFVKNIWAITRPHYFDRQMKLWWGFKKW